MENANRRAVEALNHLLETCKDGEKGFRTAAEAVQMPDLKQLFDSYASQRGVFAGQLQAEVERLGGAPERSGHVVATLHRGWMRIKSLVAGHDPSGIIAECEQGEDAAMKAYEEALKVSLPAEAEAMVKLQFAQVKDAHERVRALKAAAKP